MTQRRRNIQGPQFVQYFDPVIQALKKLGGSGRPNEVVEQIVSSRPSLTEQEKEQMRGGATRIEKNIHWARFYLAKTGFIDSSSRGVWVLTADGRSVDKLTRQQALELFQTVQDTFRKKDEEVETENSAEDLPAVTLMDDAPIEFQHRISVLDRLKNLPPSGFERFCQQLLRESGFEQVIVTGRSGDGGIDGVGTLMITPLMSFKVAFQCKRYATGTVGPSIVRDFRGSIMGRADKGIILTTSSFTSDASKEAIRDGAIPIELIDGDKLLRLMELLEFGLNKQPIIRYEIKEDFFNQFDS